MAINFENSNLFNHSQWYPEPQGDPEDIGSFKEGQAYICYIEKAYCVFRFVFSSEGYYYNYENQRNPFIATGIDLLIQHNLPENAWINLTSRIEATIHDAWTGNYSSNSSNLTKLIVSYVGVNHFFGNLLYPLVIQEALTKRKSDCVNQQKYSPKMYRHFHNRELRKGETFEDVYAGSACALFNVQHLIGSLKHDNEGPQFVFRVIMHQDRGIRNNLSPYFSKPSVSTPPWSTSLFIKKDYLQNRNLLPDPDSPISPMIKLYIKSLQAKDADIPAFIPPKFRMPTCWRAIVYFLEDLWDKICDLFDCC